VRLQGLVDQGLIALAGLSGLGPEALDDRVVHVEIVMRVFPVVGTTAPRLPLEKAYTFFMLAASLFGSKSADTGSVYSCSLN